MKILTQTDSDNSETAVIRKAKGNIKAAVFDPAGRLPEIFLNLPKDIKLYSQIRGRGITRGNATYDRSKYSTHEAELTDHNNREHSRQCNLCSGIGKS